MTVKVCGRSGASRGGPNDRNVMQRGYYGEKHERKCQR